MIEAKEGKVSLSIQPYDKLADVAVAVSVKCDLSSCVMNRLKGVWCCDCRPKGTEETCVLYSMYLVALNKMRGDPAALASSKVGAVSVGYHNGSFVMSWNTAGKITNVRKSLSIAMSSLRVNGLYSVYSQVVKGLGISSNSDQFNKAAAAVVSALNSGVSCCVIGKIKATNAHADAIVGTVSKKLDPGKAGDKKASAEAVPCNHSDMPELKVSGWAAYVTKLYLSNKVRGLKPVLCDKSLYVPVKPAVFPTLRTKAKAGVDDYVQRKFAKSGANSGNLLAYAALSCAELGCHDAKSLMSASVASIKTAISGAL